MIDWDKAVTAEKQQELKAVADRERVKSERQAAVDAIVVEVDGLPFDGNDISQSRMQRMAQSLGDGELITWVLANNSSTKVSRYQLLEATRLAALRMAEIWTGS